MRNRRIGRERRADLVGGSALGRRDGHGHDDAPGFGGQPRHAFGVLADSRDQDLAAVRDETADRRLDREMAAALHGQCHEFRRRPARDTQQPVEDVLHERCEITVPRREILPERSPDLGPRHHRSGNQKQHGMT